MRPLLIAGGGEEGEEGVWLHQLAGHKHPGILRTLHSVALCGTNRAKDSIPSLLPSTLR